MRKIYSISKGIPNTYGDRLFFSKDLPVEDKEVYDYMTRNSMWRSDPYNDLCIGFELPTTLPEFRLNEVKRFLRKRNYDPVEWKEFLFTVDNKLIEKTYMTPEKKIEWIDAWRQQCDEAGTSYYGNSYEIWTFVAGSTTDDKERDEAEKLLTDIFGAEYE